MLLASCADMWHSCRQAYSLKIPGTWYTNFAACDKMPLCQRTMLANPDGPMHVFSDLMECIPEDDRKTLKKLRPAVNASSQSCKDAYGAQREHLEKNKHRIWTPGNRAACCLRHPGQLCRVSWTCPDGIDTREQPLSVSFSTPMCTPWTSQGDKNGEADEAMESFHLWVTKMSASTHDIIWFENSKSFPWHLFDNALAPHWDTYGLVFGPQDLGHPTIRNRTYGVALRKESMVWVGPIDNVALKALFLGFFERRVVLEGDIWAGADSKENIKRHRDELAAKRGYFSGAQDMSLMQLLAPGGQDTLKALHAIYEETTRTGIGGCLVGDVSQSEKRIRCSPWIPPCAKSTVLIAVNSDHLYTPTEVESAHGWPYLRAELKQCIPAPLHELSASEAKLLSGNGMHLAQVFAWLLFTMTHTLRREPLKYYKPMLPIILPRSGDQLPVVAPSVPPEVLGGDRTAQQPGEQMLTCAPCAPQEHQVPDLQERLPDQCLQSIAPSMSSGNNCQQLEQVPPIIAPRALGDHTSQEGEVLVAIAARVPVDPHS
jgi:hypothetical protein